MSDTEEKATTTVSTTVTVTEGTSQDGAKVETAEVEESTTVLTKRAHEEDDAEPTPSQEPKKRKVSAMAASGSLLGYFKPKPKANAPAEASSAPNSDLDLPPATETGKSKDAIEDLERRTLAKDWRDALQAEFTKDYFIKLKEFVKNEYKTQTVYPIPKDVYSWSRLTKLEAVKVVVIGQDPYHQPGQAHGLSFSVKDPVAPPPSLKNIYKQVATDIPNFKIPKSGDLTLIARQGVLWLNTSLTVRRSSAASHSKKGWETFTTAVLKAVATRKTAKGVVFLAWGAHAQKIVKDVNPDKKKHLILSSAHPSPLSAHNGFFGNGHFKKTNEWLAKNYGIENQIDWTVLNPEEEEAKK
ncbi:uracil DNA glycosylase [Tulasnella sp. 424]|nr:uracil DNA glycosylase [Tulasnella sp. 424]KAG8977834.1 uracil DNA glycosylase [Tulasnella sp. 425]